MRYAIPQGHTVLETEIKAQGLKRRPRVLNMGAFLCLVWKARQRYNKNIEVIRNVVSVCFRVGGVRGPDVHPGQGGHRGVDSNLATAIRTAVVLALAWGMVFLTGAQKGIQGIGPKSWLFLILSGLATGGILAVLLPMRCQIGAASKVCRWISSVW